MGLFFRVWFCQHCGQELCGNCYDLLPSTSIHVHQEQAHNQDAFVPVSIFHMDELRDTIQAMDTINKTVEAPQPPMAPPFVPEPDRSVPGSHVYPIHRYSLNELSEEAFAGLWATCEPFILTDVVKPTTPKEILELDPLKPHACTTAYHDGVAWIEERSTLEAYFRRTQKTSQDTRSWQVRVSPISHIVET